MDINESDMIKPKPFRTTEEEKPGYKNEVLEAIEKNLDEAAQDEAAMGDNVEKERILEEEKTIKKEEEII